MLLLRRLLFFAAPRLFPARAQTSPSATLLLALVVASLRKLTSRWLATSALKVGAELGCSRPLAENVGWLPRNLYIGVSGLQLAPKAYIALGISGQMQHMVGVQGADTIIAVNKDQNAPIFKQCDYGIVGDIYKVLPALIEAL